MKGKYKFVEKPLYPLWKENKTIYVFYILDRNFSFSFSPNFSKKYEKKCFSSNVIKTFNRKIEVIFGFYAQFYHITEFLVTIIPWATLNFTL